MNPINPFKQQNTRISPIHPADLQHFSKKTSHRRTKSKTSAELLASLKSASPKSSFNNKIVTPKSILEHLAKKGINICKPPEAEETFSDEESNIRQLTERRKILSPITYKDLKNNHLQESDKSLVHTSTTALTVNEENNMDRVLFVLKNQFLKDKSLKNSRKTIKDLMKKCTESCFALALDEYEKLKGIYYLEQSTGYFHRIIADDDSPIILPPRRIKKFLSFDANSSKLIETSVNRFEAILYST